MSSLISDFKPGTRLVIKWESNPKGGVKANHVQGVRAPKIILPISGDGSCLKAGQTWACDVERVTNPNSDRHGVIIVRPVSQQIDCSFDDIWIDPEQAQLMAVVLQHPERNLFLEGSQGVGKTTICSALADRFGWVLRKIEGSQIKKHNQMFGRVMPSAKDGQLDCQWYDSPLVELIREATALPDQVILALIDEYTRIDEDARDILLPVIEGKNRLLQTPRPETLVIPRNIRWVAAGNVGEGFTVKEQDDANMSRWVVLEIDYMPFAEELKHCLRKYPTCPPDVLEKALKIIHSLRKIIGPKMRINKSVCTRMSETAAMFISEGVNIRTAINTAVANQFRGRMKDSTSERARIAQKVAEALEGKSIES